MKGHVIRFVILFVTIILFVGLLKNLLSSSSMGMIDCELKC